MLCMQEKKEFSGKGGVLCWVGLGIPGPWKISWSHVLKPLTAGSVFLRNNGFKPCFALSFYFPGIYLSSN